MKQNGTDVKDYYFCCLSPIIEDISRPKLYDLNYIYKIPLLLF
jgi:hypothetical protein